MFSKKYAAIVGVIAIVAILSLAIGIKNFARITPPPEYPDANFRLDFPITENIVITDIFFTCAVGGHNPPLTWCSTQALNTPIEGKIGETVTLWFHVDPPPQSMTDKAIVFGVDSDKDISYNSIYEGEALRRDHWKIVRRLL